jgi:hypothetical protein
MLAAGVAPKMVADRLEKGVARTLPFRFVTAARHAPKLEEAIEKAMLKGIAGLDVLPGVTGLVVDVSGSMNYRLAKKGETTRMDAAAGLAMLLRERAEEFDVATFSDKCRTGPESCVDSRKAEHEALTGAHAGGVLSREILRNQSADAVSTLGRQHREIRQREHHSDSARSSTPSAKDAGGK